MCRARRAAGLLLLFPLLLSLTSCGANVCDVTGKITYRGKPVVCGSVIFVGYAKELRLMLSVNRSLKST